MTPEQAAQKYLFEINPLNSSVLNRLHFHVLVEIIHAQRESAMAEAMAWRPIETAPKDGTRFLGFSETSGKMFVCRWEDRPLRGGHWTVYLDGEDGWIYHLGKDPQWLIVKPVTHWMPLPPAPQEGEG